MSNSEDHDPAPAPSDDCACLDAWIPDGRAENARPGMGSAGGAVLLFEPVPPSLGGILGVAVERPADQWPPGVDPGVRCTVLLI